MTVRKKLKSSDDSLKSRVVKFNTRESVSVDALIPSTNLQSGPFIGFVNSLLISQLLEEETNISKSLPKTCHNLVFFYQSFSFLENRFS